MMSQQQRKAHDTDQHQAIRLKHISPTWVKWLDREVGIAKRRNGGFAELTARLEQGRMGSVRWLLSFLPEQMKRDLDTFSVLEE